MNQRDYSSEPYLLEACVETLSQAQQAQDRGAHQIELCADLSVGGITPSRELIKEARRTLILNIKVMIRPRGGNFVYSIEEIEQMKQSILFCKSLSINGVVFGVLHSDNSLNLEHIQVLAELAAPMEVTIHRAIDETPDILEATRALMQLGDVDCILSSGQANTAMEGKEQLLKMVQLTEGQLRIIPAGRVSSGNIEELHSFVGAGIYHGTKIVGILS